MKKTLSVLFVVIIASSCSVKSLYNYSDFLLVRYISSQVSLSDPLYSELKMSSKRLLSWHRSTQLPGYVDLIDSVRVATKNHVTHVQAGQFLIKINEMISVTMQQMFREIVPLMPSMTESELHELFDSLGHDNQIFYEKYVSISPAKRLDLYKENMLDTFQDLFGNLNPAQHRVINQAADELLHTSKDRYLKRLDFHRKMYSILNSTAVSSVKIQNLLKLFTKNLDSSFQDMKQQHNTETILSAVVSVINLSTQKQLSELDKNLSEYKAIFASLSQQ